MKSFGSSTSNTQSTLLNLDSPSRSPSSHDALSSIIRSSGGGGRRVAAPGEKTKEKMSEGLRARTTSEAYARQMTRHWRTGDVYAPHDLSAAEMRKWRKKQPPKKDVMDVLGVNPLDMYKVCSTWGEKDRYGWLLMSKQNFSVISDFITSFGRIKHSRETGLRPVNQRKMAKTIRRAIGLGIHPSVYRHPMLLLRESQNQKGLLG